ncbi:maleylpyruvate isomerase family mycothiol-dependent enzyme [Nocardioides sp. zg-1228]|uniref:maleylpyruvate isomerase family mycothiol-dependent enzyme n=1 Tax=Nocardioides sp. zg-1228 TaxID=2763008 RepID=UPI001643303D|nr:maleylpyruvate isomerase family mycothiol-dependent enzyme [Nocardioides sp. zg-1228]MBC2932428.1 maleylpyruvate isomerase family mycothiol-dependent enzyme [Nocardioides sp. zg-1228]QSF57940.1 maleylpyruvate isomerase family mycothiol-dependent enzyme [Nocardioides sp. zg-1228]
MDQPRRPVVVLSRALDQAGDALAAVHPDDLDRPTPCEGWTVAELADHLAAAPEHFLQLARGEQVDWSARTGVDASQLAAHFRTHADDLLHHWHTQPDDQVAQADWQSAELGVHTWDLVRALGLPPLTPLDDEVAERGLAFLQQGLTADNRGDAFGAAVDLPDDASRYDRLAAFAGRDPRA